MAACVAVVIWFKNTQRERFRRQVFRKICTACGWIAGEEVLPCEDEGRELILIVRKRVTYSVRGIYGKQLVNFSGMW